MLKVHLNDGQTLNFDLAEQAQAVQWSALARDPAFQSRITGLTIADRGVQYSLPKPSGYEDGDLFLFGESIEANQIHKVKGGNRIVCQAGDVRVSMMVHKEQRAVRVAVVKTGRQKYNPV
jgi:hypothetical protein